MCSTARAFISGMVFDYPTGARADAIERKIAETLPNIPELDACMPAELQALVMERVIADQFAAFVKVWSDPFLSDKDGTETPDSLEVPSSCVFDARLLFEDNVIRANAANCGVEGRTRDIVVAFPHLNHDPLDTVRI